MKNGNLDAIHRAVRREWAIIVGSCRASGYDPTRFAECRASRADYHYPSPEDAEWVMHSLGLISGLAEASGILTLDRILRDAGVAEFQAVTP